MPNIYGRVSHLKADLAGMSGVTTLDDTYVRLLERVSRAIDEYTGQQQYTTIGTRYWPDVALRQRSTTILLAPKDYLISLSSLTVDDDNGQVWDTTLVDGTDYWLEPYTGPPYKAITLIANSVQLGTWPTWPRAVKLTGTWGSSNTTEAIALTGTLTDASDTSLTTNSAADSLIDIGETIVMASEQLYVSAVSGTTVTVTRAQNGTTATAHTAVAISRRRYPAVIEAVCIQEAVRLRWEAQGGFAGIGAAAEDAAPRARGNALSYDARRALDPYHLPGVA